MQTGGTKTLNVLNRKYVTLKPQKNCNEDSLGNCGEKDMVFLKSSQVNKRKLKVV